MTYHVSLDQCGYSLLEKEKIWIRPDYAGIAYSDGDEVERRLADIIAAASDCSVLSRELCQHITDWPSRYHLSQLRANLLRPFAALLPGKTVLEIGAGMGALSRYLGECGAEVLALEGSPRRAAIARSRTRDLPNVTVICEDFSAFQLHEQFDIVTLIGVLEYAPLFSTGDARRMLEKVRSLLKPGGQLLLAIENQLGLKYFAGAAEDHLSQPMYGLEGRYREGQPRTFGRKKLAELLTQTGFTGQEFFAPFPDYKLPVSIVSERGFAQPLFDAASLAWQSWRFDPQLPPYKNFSLELVWPEITENGLGLDLANSFLVRAQAGELPPFASETLAWHYGGSRQPVFCKETRFAFEKEKITVHYQPFNNVPPPSSTLLSFHLADSAAYYPGIPLSYVMMRLITRDGWRVDEFTTLLRHYLDIVEKFIVSLGLPPVKIESVDTMLPGQCFDVIPQNIMSLPQGEWRVIDQEWSFQQEVSAGYMLFRVITSLISHITCFGRCADQVIANNFDLFAIAFRVVGGQLAEEEFAGYLELEAKIQNIVRGYPISVDAAWGQYALPNQLLHQYAMRQNGSIAELHQQIAQQNSQLVACDRIIAEKNAHITEKNAQIAQATSYVEENTKQTDIVLGKLEQNMMHRYGRLANTNHILTRRQRAARRFSPRLWREYQALRKSPEIRFLFDEAWYRNRDPEVVASGMSALRHYVLYGAHEGRQPNPYFFPQWYLQEYPDVALCGMTPLLHFIEYGAAEGRKPNPYFDTAWYMLRYPQAAGRNPLAHYIDKWQEGSISPHPFFDSPWYARTYYDTLKNNVEPLLHYLALGVHQGKNPHPLFDSHWYLQQYPRAAQWENPLLHFIMFGALEAINPSRWFDVSWYLRQYPDVAASGIDPFLHYIEYGIKENRASTPYFHSEWYCRHYPDVAASGMNPFLHYLEYGVKENLIPIPYFDSEWYCCHYPDIAALGLNPFLHYIDYGTWEYRDPNPYFDTSYYISEYQDILLNDTSPFVDYITIGVREGRRTNKEMVKIPGYMLYRNGIPAKEICIPYKNEKKQDICDFDVIIVSYNSEKYIQQCLESLIQHEEYIHLIVVDNGSVDKTISIAEDLANKFRKFTLVRNEVNFGFGKANNIGVSHGCGNYVFLLNADTEISDADTFYKLSSMICHAGDNVAAWELRQKPYEHPKCYDPATLETGWFSAAAVVIKRSCYEECGGFDESLFMYCEDVDLSWRLRSKGYKLLYAPRISVQHYSYDFPGEIKQIAQFYGVKHNYLLRCRFGNEYDKTIGEDLVLRFKKDNISQKDICDKVFGDLDSLALHFASLAYPRNEFFAPYFNVFDYDIAREGAFYSNNFNRDEHKVSVVIRTVGRLHYLEKAVCSILNQTYDNFELIIVEDGSCMAEKLISKFADSRIIYKSIEKSGRCVAGNEGLRLSSGEYINFLDEDDMFYCDHLEVLAHELSKSSSNVGAVVALSFSVETGMTDDYPFYIDKKYELFNPDGDMGRMLDGNQFPIQAVMFKRECYEKCGGFDNDIELLEDWDLWLRYMAYYTFHRIPKTTSLFRVPADNYHKLQRAERMKEFYEKVRQKIRK